MLSKQITVLIVDDHQMVRNGIRTMLKSEVDHYQFAITESESGEDAISKVQKNDYDIVLMDYQLPKLNGTETVSLLLNYKPEIKILAMSNYDEYHYIKNMMDSGAKGYMLKNISPTELVTAIGTVLNGAHYYSHDVALKLIHYKFVEDNRMKLNINLSKRQIQILRCIANEKSNDEIAEELHIDKRTVQSHRQNIKKILGVRSSIGLIKYAIELKLLD